VPTINIQGQPVQVDDSFMKLSPEQQDETVDEIAREMLKDMGHQPPDAMPAPTPQMQGTLDQLSAMTANPGKAIHDQQSTELADKLQAGHEGSGIGAFTRGAARMGTGGLLERAEAGIGAVAGGLMAGDPSSIPDRYAMTRDALFKVRDRERASNPIASTGGELAGAVLAPVPGLGPAGSVTGGIAKG